MAGKARLKPGKPPAPQELQRRKMVEEFASLDREIDNYLPRINRHKKLRQLILDWYPDLAPDEEATVPGINVDVLISSRDKIRTVTPAGRQALLKLWGSQGFASRAHVMLKTLPDPEDPDQLYTEAALTGPRHLHV